MSSFGAGGEAVAMGGTGGQIAAAGGSTAGTGTGGSDTASAGAGGTAGSGGSPDVGDLEAPPATAHAYVSLTYDDGLDSHIFVAAPQLEAHGLRGTFLISNFPGANWALPASDEGIAMTPRQQAWQTLIGNGHEAAGHTVNHPCPSENGNSGPEFWLESYDLTRMATELDDDLARMNRLGQTEPLSFGYPCASDVHGLGQEGADYSSLVAERFMTARVSNEGLADPTSVDLMQVPMFDALEKSAAELQAAVDDAIAKNGWLVIMFHGVGGETLPPGDGCGLEVFDQNNCVINYLNTTAEAHEALVTYLEQNQDSVWTAPMGTVAQYIASQR